MSVVLQDLGIKKLYDMERPKTAPKVVSVQGYQAVSSILGDFGRFGTMYTESTQALTKGYGYVAYCEERNGGLMVGLYRFFIAFDDPVKHMKDLKLVRVELLMVSQRY